MTLWGRHRSLARVRVFAVPCVLAPVLALSACGGSQTKSTAPPGAAESASTTTSAPSTTSTTVAAANLPYSFDDNSPPPALLNTGTNWAEIARSLLDYADWLLSHRPETSLIDNVAARGTNPYKSLAHDLPILRRLNRRFVEHVSAPDRFDVVSVHPDVVSVIDTQHLVGQSIYDAQGHDVSSRPLATTRYSVLLVRSRSENRWLLASVNQQGGPTKATP